MLYPKDALSLDHRTDALSKWKYGDVLIMFLAFMSLIFSINVMLLISDDELATSSVTYGSWLISVRKGRAKILERELGILTYQTSKEGRKREFLDPHRKGPECLPTW